MPDKSKGFLIAELAAVAGVYAALQVLNAAGLMPAALKLPVLEIPWIYALFAFSVFIWLRLRGARLADYGLRSFGRPWIVLGLAALGVGASIAADAFAGSLVNSLFDAAPPDISRFEPVRGDLAMFLTLIGASWVIGGLGEEMLFRGFLMTRLAQLLGGGHAAWGLALFGQAILFGLAHSYQGASGVIMTGLSGFIYGALYLAAGRRIWAATISHGSLNTLGAYMLYSGAM